MSRNAAVKATFDDRLWPVNLAILALAGFVAWLVWQRGDLTPPQGFLEGGWRTLDGWRAALGNGYVQLGGVAASVIVLWIATAWLQHYVLHRVQLCVVVSLLVHLGLALFMYDAYLRVSSQWEAERLEAALPEPSRMPEYAFERLRPEAVPRQQAFETPVESQSAHAEPSEASPQKETFRPPVPPSKMSPAPLPTAEPSPAELKRAPRAAPRRAADAEGGPLSRQELRFQPETGAPVPLPEPRQGEAAPAMPERQLSVAPREVAAPMLGQQVPETSMSAEPSLAPAALSRPQTAPRAEAIDSVRASPAKDVQLAVPLAAIPTEAAPIARPDSLPAPLAARDLPLGRRVQAPRVSEKAVEMAESPHLSQPEPLTGTSLRRARQPGEASAPRAVELAMRPGRQPTPELEIPGGTTSPAPASGVRPPPGAEEPSKLDVAGSVGLTGPRQPGGGLPVLMPARPGPGGLGADASLALGIPDRRARPESDTVHSIPERFVMERSGSDLNVDGRVDVAPAYQRRAIGSRPAAARAQGGTAATEEAVERGILYLVRHQFPDGRWSLDRVPQSGRDGYRAADVALGTMNGDTAATGLALLAFLGAGYTHRDGAHREAVDRGLQWLLRNQQAEGQLFRDATDQTRYARFYGHGIATIALCEAFGMTRDRRLLEPTQRALGFIIRSQSPTQGGWRYDPQLESDTSVSGWKLMALKSAQMAGLEVPAGTLQGISLYLDSAQVEGGRRYIYNPYAGPTPEQQAGLVPSLPMTAEGLLMRMFLGWDRSRSELLQGAEYLKSHLPEWGTAEEPLRDCYYWYYATQVMFHLQGSYWESWRNRLHPMLQQSQVRGGPLEGSWHPFQPVRDRWAEAAGRHYVTSMHLLMLEAPYRHLPLYRLGQ